MIMKSAAIVLTSFFLFFGPLYAGDKPLVVKAPVTSVNVYLNAAQISHSVKVKLKPGINKCAFTGLAMNIQQGHVSLRNLGSAELLTLSLYKISDMTDVATLHDDVLSAIGKSRDSLLIVEKSISRLSYEIAGLDLEKNMLVKNDDIIPNSKTISLEELKLTTAYYRERYRDVNLEIDSRKKELDKLKKLKVKLLKSAFSTENENEENLNFSVIIAEVNNTGAEFTAEPLLVYIAKESGWIPVYDVFSSNNKSLKLEYGAKILNNTGIDWNKQTITLSTADPFAYYAAPDLEPFYIGGYSYGKYNKYSNKDYDDYDQQQQKQQNPNEEDIFIPDHEIKFNLTKAYDFKSGLVPVYVDVTSYDLSPEYVFRCAPKKEQQVYSIARIKDWEKLNLIDGEANIYNNGIFLGKAYIRPSDIEDHLELPLGIVDYVYVKHRLVSEYSGKKILAGDIVATRNYEIKLKNTGTEKIVIELIDQVPVSEESSVKTEGVEYTEGGEKDALTGKITWKVELGPSSEKSYLLKYSVTYPRKRGYSPFSTYKVKKTRSKF